ncbi:MAG: aminoacyl-tRNA hydrolase [Treponema sp.]|nr:aminoacyl-tRNA hydrolase [Treponema sp.]
MIELVAFLGNYGEQYADTRHNAPWLFADSLPFADRLSWSSKFKAEYASAENIVPGVERKIHFIKPLTYMNLSGDAISEAAHFFKITPDRVLVIHDEIELPPGTLSLKFGGGLGGHNGLRSTKEKLGTADFWRIRLGIGKCTDGNVASYVLGHFSSDEKILLSQMFGPASELLTKVLSAKDPSNLLKEWSKKKVIPEVSK